MQVFFIKQNKNVNFIKSKLTPIEIQEDIITINTKLQKDKEKLNIIRKIKRKIGITTIILSKELKKNRQLIDLFYSNEFKIITGRKIFQNLTYKNIDKICEKNNIKMPESYISILINEINNIDIKIIEKLANNFKLLNLVTNHTKYFAKIQDKLLQQKGIVITVTNNKKKALSRSNIILNIDFPEELINKYTIYEKSILVNMEENVKIKKKRFNGKIINDYQISLKKDTNIEQILKQEKYKYFDLMDLSEIYIINSPEEIENIIIY